MKQIKYFAISLSVIMTILAIGCAHPDKEDRVARPPGPVPIQDTFEVNELKEHDQSIVDEPYVYDEATVYRTTDVLPNLDVRSLALIDDVLYLGAADGLYRLSADESKFELVYSTAASGPVVGISEDLDHQGYIVAATPNNILLVKPDGSQPNYIFCPTAGNLTDVFTTGSAQPIIGGLIIAAATDGVYFAYDSGDCQKKEGGVEARSIDSGVYATEQGIGLIVGNDMPPFISYMYKNNESENGPWLPTNPERETATGFDPNDVRDVAVFSTDGSSSDGLVAATSLGLAYYGVGSYGSLSQPFFFLPGKGGLPTDDNTAVDAEGDTILVGHRAGATAIKLNDAMEIAKVDHYRGLRWLPSYPDPGGSGDWIDPVTAVQIDPAKNRYWIATAGGVSRIDHKTTTLTQKADQMQDMLDQYYWRLGFVSSDLNFSDPWDIDGGNMLGDKDNDGLWTEMQIGPWCMAYAITGEQKYYDAARRAMDMMFMLIDIPAVTFEEIGRERGFIARSLVRDDEGDVYESKKTQDNWHQVEWSDGHTYFWKDDTSSDEIAGHFFGMPLFYDLCASSPEEKREVAAYASMVIDHIIGNGFRLVDLDGEKTTHGHWQPEALAIALDGVGECSKAGYSVEDCLDSYGGGGWLNSIEILGALLATYRMTGDDKYYAAYDELITVHRYDELVEVTDHTGTVTIPGIVNHSDHELAMLAYFTLLRYETDPVRRAQWLESMKELYFYELYERNPVWMAFLAIASPDGFELEDGIGSLREIPFDLRDWGFDNRHRLDAELLSNKDRHGRPEIDTVFPYDEIRTIWWNGNLAIPYEGSGPAHQAAGPMMYLLPYWSSVYAGVLKASGN